MAGESPREHPRTAARPGYPRKEAPQDLWLSGFLVLLPRASEETPSLPPFHAPGRQGASHIPAQLPYAPSEPANSAALKERARSILWVRLLEPWNLRQGLVCNLLG